MDTSYSPSKGAGYPPIHGSSDRQQQKSYAQQLESLNVQPLETFPTHHHSCCGPCRCFPYPPPGSMPTPQQLEDFYRHNYHVHYQQQQVHYQQQEVHNQHQQQQQEVHNQHQHQQPTPPMVCKRPSPEDLQEPQRNTGDGRTSPGDVEMPDVQTEDSVAKQTTSMAVQQGGSASTAKTTVHEQGSSRNSRPQGDDREAWIPVSQSQKKKGPGMVKWVQNAAQTAAQTLLGGSSHGSDDYPVDLSNTDKSLNRESHYSDTWKKEKEKMLDRIATLETNLRERQERQEELRKKNDELKRSEGEARNILDSVLKIHESEVAKYKAAMNMYKANADKFSEQLSILEQSNSKQVGGTGAHKDSHAIPPNLEKSATFVNQTALTCTKTFITFLKERRAFESHPAVKRLPKGHTAKYRTYAVEAYICRVMFAGFENDSYMDSLDCLRSAAYLPDNYEKDSSYFLQDQDLERRYKQYLSEYDSLQKLGLQGIVEKLKDPVGVDNNKNAANCPIPFLQFCCRKLVSIMDGVSAFSKEFPPSGDYSERFLLQQLATDPAYCDKFLKPFVNLAIAAFQLHRLAFQFHPPARIFRYAPGTAFDHAYMLNAVPIDDDDDFVPEDFIVGLMLIPGFQVGATIIKCIVYLVPRNIVTAPTDEVV